MTVRSMPFTLTAVALTRNVLLCRTLRPRTTTREFVRVCSNPLDIASRAMESGHDEAVRAYGGAGKRAAQKKPAKAAKKTKKTESKSAKVARPSKPSKPSKAAVKSAGTKSTKASKPAGAQSTKATKPSKPAVAKASKTAVKPAGTTPASTKSAGVHKAKPTRVAASGHCVQVQVLYTLKCDHDEREADIKRSGKSLYNEHALKLAPLSMRKKIQAFLRQVNSISDGVDPKSITVIAGSRPGFFKVRFCLPGPAPTEERAIEDEAMTIGWVVDPDDDGNYTIEYRGRQLLLGGTLIQSMEQVERTLRFLML